MQVAVTMTFKGELAPLTAQKEPTELTGGVSGSWLNYEPSPRSALAQVSWSGGVRCRPPKMWQPVFLAALADGSTEEGPATGGNISRAAARAEVNPVVAHYYRRIDPAFARAWAAAFEQGVDAVEGLSDYLTAHSKGDLAAVVRSTPTYRGDELRLTSIGELLAEPDDEIEWVVENRIAPASTNVVAGAPKTGKSNARRCEIR